MKHKEATCVFTVKNTSPLEAAGPGPTCTAAEILGTFRGTGVDQSGDVVGGRGPYAMQPSPHILAPRDSKGHRQDSEGWRGTV